VAIVGVLAGCSGEPGEPHTGAREQGARVAWVSDGDTLRVRLAGQGDSTRVRLLAIDTPETRRPGTPVECGGRGASAYMRRLALKRGRGRRVRVSSDPTQDTRDRYGRQLAYVHRRRRSGSSDGARRPGESPTPSPGVRSGARRAIGAWRRSLANAGWASGGAAVVTSIALKSPQDRPPGALGSAAIPLPASGEVPRMHGD